MLTLKEIGNIPTLLNNSLLSTTKLWSTPVDNLHPVQFAAFLKSMQIEHRGDEAKTNITIALNELIKASARGDIPYVPIMSYQFPDPPPMISHHFTFILKQLPLMRRQAILFGLECALDLDEITSLYRLEAIAMKKRGELTSLAKDILLHVPRPLNCSYLFYEYLYKVPIPLFGLAEDIHDQFGMDYDMLQKAYRNMVYYDYDMLEIADQIFNQI